MNLPVYDLAVPRGLATSLALFIDGILAGEAEEGPLEPDYVRWARRCAARFREGDDDFVGLDEYDMSMLGKDVLPDFVGSRTRSFDELIDQKAGREPLLAVLEDMSGAAAFMTRLHKATNFDMFDDNWKGDRP